MRISELEEGIFKKIKNTFTGPSRQQVWSKRLAKSPAPSAPPTSEPAATSAPTSVSGTIGGSFAQPMQAAATAKAAPASTATPSQAKPRMSVRAATGPVYTAGQKKNVGGVSYTWDGQVWRDPRGNPATQGIANAINQQSSQTG